MKKTSVNKKSVKVNPTHNMPFGEIMERIVRVKPKKEVAVKKTAKK